MSEAGQRIREFLDAIPDLCFILDSAGVFRSFKASSGIPLCYSPDEFLGKSISDLFPPAIARPATECVCRALESGAVQTFRYDLPDGAELRHYEARMSACSTDLVLVVVRDVTELRRAEDRMLRALEEARRAGEELRRTEEIFRSSFESAPVGMCMVDPLGRFLRVNGALCAMLGYAREELLDRTFEDVTHPDDLEASRKWVRGVASGEGASADLEKRYVHKDGSTVWGIVRSVLLREPDGTPRYFVTHVQDITVRKQLEKKLLQSQKMEAVGRLAGGIAHDFNNILTVITGYVSLILRRGGEGGAFGKELLEIRKAAERAADLTRQLLTFSRRQAVQPKVVGLNGIVLGTESILRRLIGEDIELSIAVDPAAGSVLVDPSRLEQVVINLALNARDAMPGGGHLEIRTEGGDPEVLTVSDTGVGMDPDTMSKIFDPFFTTKEIGKGTGLGLATVYGIVAQAGGRIDVESKRGRGTTFTICLPRAEADGSSEEGCEERHVPGGRETILVVEDETAVRDLVKEVLTALGYDVLTANDGSEAMRVSREFAGPIHLLLTDVVMPGISGVDLAERLAADRPGVAVLFMSGYVGARGRAVAADEGDNFIRKPFSPGALAAAVRKALSSGACAGSAG